MIRRWPVGIALCALSLFAASCEREIRPFQTLAVASARTQKPVLSPIFPGGQPLPEPNESPFQKNAYGTAEGKRLFDQYNCTGCHSHGGGGMGPPLMDDKWVYGSEPANIFESIVEGRPNGMPSFRNRIPEYQAWEIAAYVRSMAGLLPKGVSPNRTDQMNIKPAESSTPKQVPTGITGVLEQPK